MNVPVGPYFIRLETNTRTQAEGGSRIEGEPLIRAGVWLQLKTQLTDN